jgi:hypothetical protein
VNVARPRRRNPATAVAKSAISHVTVPNPTLALPRVGLAGALVALVALDILAEAVRSAISAAMSDISPATAMRAEEADMEEGVMDRAKADMEAEVAMPVEAVARARRATPVEAMVICLATAPKVRNVITVSSSAKPPQPSNDRDQVEKSAI